jgi:Rps23 Pro-64 3,4-dihydroxylase Tpa1-like proline 4-hydroxylase
MLVFNKPWSRTIIICFIAAALFVGAICFMSIQEDRRTAKIIHAKQSVAAKIENSVIQQLFEAVSQERLEKIANKYKKKYAQNSPFSHVAIDGIFPQAFLEEVVKENPESDIADNGCLYGNLKTCFQGVTGTQNKKSFVENEDLMGLHTRILFSVMKSSNFVKFLEEVTGISDIIPDPHFRGSGLHFTASGGNLDVHADFNKYQKFNLDRRVNAFIYLNPDWPEEYGGHLELWSRDMKSCQQRILPTLGRFVVFSSTDFSYHGHPQPLPAPKGRARRSIALYYYTNGRPQEECVKNDCNGNVHTTLFQTPVGCKVCEESNCKAFDESASIPREARL